MSVPENRPLQFSVQGSSPDPYIVTFERRGTNLLAFCTCAAGAAGQSCKHRLSILEGDLSALVDGTAHEVNLVCSWLPGTDLQRALVELANAEAALNAAKKLVSRAKAQISVVMRGA